MATPGKTAQHPMIIRHVQPHRSGIQSLNLTRHAIGYILRGRKYIYYGDVRYEIERGEIFFLGAGNHYMEDVPEAGKSFEQVTFFYTSEALKEILNNLSQSFNLEISDNHSCDNCRNKPHATYPAWNPVKNFFKTTNQYLKEDILTSDAAVEKMKMTELIYLIEPGLLPEG